MRWKRVCASLLMALLLFACAGPARLAKMSERELKAGNLAKAYDLARRGVVRDPTNDAARRAMTAAAARMVEDRRRRLLGIAEADTVAASLYALELHRLLSELDSYRIEVPADPAFDSLERSIRDAGAGIEYRRGDQALAARRPREAYARFEAAAGIMSGYRDVQEKIRQAHEAALTRVAILPFANETDVPDLSKSLADAVYAQVSTHLDARDFPFTRLSDPDEIYASMTVKELESLSPEAGLRIGHGVEAGRIVVGRLHGLRASSTVQTFDQPIYRRTAERDTAGRTFERYRETQFTAVSRQRVVTVRCDFQVLDTRTGAVLATRSEPLEWVARTVWTGFRAEGDCSAYSLLTPEVRQHDPERRRAVEARWKEGFGDWKLPELLERSRRESRRSSYQASYRDEFRHASRERPVLLGELPSENDLARMALEEVWRPVLATLKELDGKD